MLKKLSLLLVTLGLLCWSLGPTASAQVQVPKSGKFSVHYGWKGVNDVRDLGDGVLFLIGEDHGAIFNDAGSGIMHHAASTCPRTVFVRSGNFTGNGHCYVVDADGDKIFIIFQCEGPAKGPGPQEGRCLGIETFLGGTGKYEGITGKIEFHGGLIGAGPHGYSVWKGEYRIP